VGGACLQVQPTRYLGVSQIEEKVPGGIYAKISSGMGGRADPNGRRWP
jgi:hypothetical protein